MKKQNNNPIKNSSVSYLIVASLLILASCSSNTDTPSSNETATDIPAQGVYNLSGKQFQSSNMELGKLEMKDFHQVVKANGMFDVPPANRASVSAYYGGYVKDIQLLSGERVKKGQVLFVLENPDYVQFQQDFLEAKGQLAYLKSNYERQKNLVQDNVTSQKNYLKAESDYTVTRVKVESLGKKLALMNINPKTLSLETIRTTVNVLSPISGYVNQVNITRGAFLELSQVAIAIVDVSHLHLELNIFEKDLAKVSIGQPILFRIQENNNKEYKASVHLVNKTVDTEKRTIGIHGHLLDEKLANRFNPGMYVEADIYTSSESRPSLPKDALVDIEGKYYVLVLQNNASNTGYSFIKREVKTGSSNNGSIEILNTQDFKENTEFLVKGAFNLITE